MHASPHLPADFAWPWPGSRMCYVGLNALLSSRRWRVDGSTAVDPLPLERSQKVLMECGMATDREQCARCDAMMRIRHQVMEGLFPSQPVSCGPQSMQASPASPGTTRQRDRRGSPVSAPEAASSKREGVGGVGGASAQRTIQHPGDRKKSKRCGGTEARRDRQVRDVPDQLLAGAQRVCRD